MKKVTLQIHADVVGTFKGAVYPVNPKVPEILGRRTYASLTEIGQPVDLVALSIPAAGCVEAAREAVALGAGAIVVVAGGFGETGTPEGRAYQDEIAAICRQAGIRLLGPNTVGFANLSLDLAVSFWAGLNELPKGNISVVAQSGGVSVIIATQLQNAGYGVHLSVGLGNSVDVTPVDVIDYLAADEATSAIALHFEGLPNGRDLCAAIRRAVARKPVVALTIGRADVGSFAKSHTGNLVGSFALKCAALRQAGAVVAASTNELVDALAALSRGRIAPSPEPRVGVVTGQGGAGLLMLDELRSNGVAVPEFAPETLARIRELLPPMTYINNPVDTARPTPTFGEVLKAVAADPRVDGVLAYMVREAGVDIPEMIAAAKAGMTKPLVIGSGGFAADVAADFARLRAAGVPAFGSPERAAKAMRMLVEDARNSWGALNRVPPALRDDPPPLGPEPMDEAAAKELLNLYGVPTPRAAGCADRAAALATFHRLAKPVAVKVLNPAVVHKTEVGGVHLGIATEAELTAALDAIDRIPAPTPSRYLLEEMARPGIELIVGGLNDASFGPSVMVGMGGTAAEAIKDTALRLAPVCRDEAIEMLDSLKTAALLKGWRGAPAVDAGKVADIIVGVGRMLAEHPEIAELDINPLRAFADGCLALDAVVVARICHG